MKIVNIFIQKILLSTFLYVPSSVLGVDIKIKCLACNRSIMMDRIEFDKKLKKVEEY